VREAVGQGLRLLHGAARWVVVVVVLLVVLVVVVGWQQSGVVTAAQRLHVPGGTRVLPG
jgi:small-conductance mechanosensitive channel